MKVTAADLRNGLVEVAPLVRRRIALFEAGRV